MSEDDPGSGDRPERSRRVRRRPLLYSIGAMGAVAGCAGLEGEGGENDSSGDETDAGDDDASESVDGANWEPAADERIRDHRTAQLEVRVVDGDGDPVDGAEVAVEMREHEFGFGTAVNATTLLEETEEGDEYREYIPELFNKAVLENGHKWRFWEDERELADGATEWLLEQGLRMRGHACLWANVDGWAVPPDVVEAMGIEWEEGGVTDPDEDPEHVRERTFDHLETIVEHYGDEMAEWDVVNEAIHEPELATTIDGNDVDPVEAPVLAEWYHEAADTGVGVDVNDYNVLAGPHNATRSRYRDQIEFLLEEGVEIDGIGMQCHFSGGETLEPDEIMAGLDSYADYGADLRITEYDTDGATWDDEEKGEYLYTFLKTVFSHPATTDFLMWGFWDGRHWHDEAPLFDDDWEPKPAYDAYTELVFEQWWTDERGETDDGVYETRGFKGMYEITAALGEATATADATLSDGGDTVDLELEADENE
ncbi:endo-1,4-beta-xylanase [Natrialba swarupiae]|uniref:endo-1,4-beta-xylanase n=1 Tax=Natrialba swarupiae TaxID=2448032 RepID=A0A5D5ANV4_9EURY|nr:endo-1,4-beta-xylanase [Natrialba swarupiae]TYT63366.1 hypothetical protein FYC77_04655 [Natrialba swarupiae]